MIMDTALQTKEAICKGCISRTCCYHYRVSITGFDLWRIASALDIRPSQFVGFTYAEADAEHAFILDHSGERYELVLAKSTNAQRLGACVFLVRTNTGIHRCGLGHLSPLVCRQYPGYFKDGLMQVINNPNACWRTWSIVELDVDLERALEQSARERLDDYDAILRDWNERVRESSPDSWFSFEQFCTYLENRYVTQFAT